jgi:hypothetical protein
MSKRSKAALSPWEGPLPECTWCFSNPLSRPLQTNKISVTNRTVQLLCSWVRQDCVQTKAQRVEGIPVEFRPLCLRRDVHKFWNLAKSVSVRTRPVRGLFFVFSEKKCVSAR